MGQYEDQLKAMGTADAAWKIEEFDALEQQMTQLKLDMSAMSKNPGWTGASAEAASALFLKLKEDFAANEAKLATARAAIDRANEIRLEAAGKKNSLPDSGVPDWVHAAALVGGSVLIPVPGIGTFAAEMVVQKVNEFMGAQREAAAYTALETMKSSLDAPQGELKASTISGKDGTPPDWPDKPTTPDSPPVVWNGDANGNGAWSTGGGGGGGGGTSIEGIGLVDRPRVIYDTPPYPPVVLPPVHPAGWPDNVIVRPPTVSIDGDVGSGTSGGGGFSGGGGLGGGLFGAGVTGGAGLAAAKLASKGGLGGGGGLFGPNGVLGGGAGTNGGAANAGAAGGKGGAAAAGKGGAAASGRGGTGMMGGGQGGGGSSEKDKRTSLGLMAPKLEDDEENGPRSAAAGAGGRD